MEFTVDYFLRNLFFSIEEELGIDAEDFDSALLTTEQAVKIFAETVDSIRVFLCLDCNINTSENNEYYMVKDSIWRSAVPDEEGMLCISCLEDRVGRELVPNDFTDCPLNQSNLTNGSDLLKSRINNA